MEVERDVLLFHLGQILWGASRLEGKDELEGFIEDILLDLGTKLSNTELSMERRKGSEGCAESALPFHASARLVEESAMQLCKITITPRHRSGRCHFLAPLTLLTLLKLLGLTGRKTAEQVITCDSSLLFLLPSGIFFVTPELLVKFYQYPPQAARDGTLLIYYLLRPIQGEKGEGA